LFAFIPAKYLPKRGVDLGKTFDGNESIISLIGLSNFLLLLLIWTLIMGIAALATYKNLGIKKDIKNKTILKFKGEVSRVDSYEGKPYIRVKKVKGVKVLHFNESNYMNLLVGDEIEFEVYKHSKILIKILSRKSKKSNHNPIGINKVEDICPGCLHELKHFDNVCL
jgi:preprotein translocase subunit SecF